MKKITKFSVNYPVTVSMIALAIILLGWISLRKLGVDLLPEMNAPRIFIEVKAGERPPEEIEKQFIENIESMSIRQKGVTQVSSICMVGSARVTVEYAWGRDMDEAFLDIQKALTTLSQNSDIDEFTIEANAMAANPPAYSSNPKKFKDLEKRQRKLSKEVSKISLSSIAQMYVPQIEEANTAMQRASAASSAYLAEMEGKKHASSQYKKIADDLSERLKPLL